MEFSFSFLNRHSMSHLCAVSMIMSFSMKTGRHFIRYHTYFFHNIYFATFWPSLLIPIYITRHHPKCRPSPLTLRQHHASFNVSILPALRFMGIDTTGIYLSIISFKTMNTQLPIWQFCHPLAIDYSIHIILEFIVYPTCILHFMSPMSGIELCTFSKLIMPN